MREKTEAGGYHGGNHLRRGGVEAAYFDEEFQTDIVDEYAADYHHKVAYELCLAAKLRPFERYVARQPETAGERDWKCDDKRGDVRAHGDMSDFEHLVTEDEIVEYEVEHPIEHHVDAAGHAVTEQLVGHYFPERAIDKIYDFQYRSLYCRIEGV